MPKYLLLLVRGCPGAVAGFITMACRHAAQSDSNGNEPSDAGLDA